jgi:FkbM family methyltransferase
MRLASLAVAAVVTVGVAFAFRHSAAARKARAAAIWATGDATGCSFGAALGEISPALGEGTENIKAKSKLMREDGDLELWQTPYGEFWNPKGNALFFDLAEQDIDIYGKDAEAVHAGDVVLDCGANVGTFTRTALKAGAARVVTFEIDPRNLAALKRTFSEEISAGKVTVVEKGVWDKPGSFEGKFYRNTNLNSMVMAERTETREQPIVKQVPLVPIDMALDELGISHVDFIKMDVEGAEPKALAGARQTILRDKPRLSIATENEPDDIKTVPAWVNSLNVGYRLTNGPCRRIRPWVIRPEVVFFSAR